MKKKIAIVSKKMIIGGIEKVMLSMISEIDKDKYDITLFLQERGGELDSEIPSSVKVRYLFEESKSIRENIVNSLKRINLKDVCKFVYSGIRIYMVKDGYFTYKDRSRVLPEQKENFDLAISYHNPISLPTIYTIDKIKAKKKAMWIHTDIKEYINEADYLKNYYYKYDKIFSVSPGGAKSFGKKYPDLKDKIEVFYNRMVKEEIVSKVDDKNYYNEFNGINLLTVGRICYQKAIDLIPKISKKLKDDGYKFRWYCVGWGEVEKIKELIKKYDVEDCFILLGSSKNPYNYMKNCDIYVQPSRYEGYVTTITEAKCFERPIVATNIEGIKEQIVNEKTGILVECSVDELYRGVKKLLDDESLRNKLSVNLSKENIDTRNEINKLYRLID